MSAVAKELFPNGVDRSRADFGMAPSPRVSNLSDGQAPSMHSYSHEVHVEGGGGILNSLISGAVSGVVVTIKSIPWQVWFIAIAVALFLLYSYQN